MASGLFIFALDGFFWQYPRLGASLEVAIVGSAQVRRNGRELAGPVGRLDRPIRYDTAVLAKYGSTARSTPSLGETRLVLLSHVGADLETDSPLVANAVAYPIRADADPKMVTAGDLWPEGEAKVVLTNDGYWINDAIGSAAGGDEF